jgi:glycerophosphoryl diester phosphodiesterase
MKRALRLAMWLLWCVGAGWGAAAERPGDSLPGTLRWMVIAHRGEHRSHPENTLEAIEGAIRAGADLVEMDVRRSSDGQYLLMHDATVDRMTDGKGRVSEKTWQELSALTVMAKAATNPVVSRIPKLEQALEACRGRIQVYLDFKAGDPSEVVQILKQTGMESRVWVYDHPSGAARWRKVLPGVRMILSPPAEARRDEEVLRQFVSQYRPEVVDQAPSREFVGWCRDLGTRVWPDIQRADERPGY